MNAPPRIIIATIAGCLAGGPAVLTAQPSAGPAPVGLALSEDPLNLEARGTTIGSIGIRVDNVFDTSNPSEDKPLYRWANRVHRITRPHVIDNILLFEQGEPLTERLLAETERLLRSQPFIADATIVARDFDPASNTANVDVHVRDAWSLEPDLSFSRGGGANEYGIGVTDDNLFGLGKSMTISFESDVDRDERTFQFTDPNFRGSRMRMNVDLVNASDGHNIGFGAGRPFFELDSRWSVTGRMLDNERVVPMYDLGEIIDRFRHDTRFATIEGGRSRGLIEGRARRWIAGITFEEDSFLPAAGKPPPVLQPLDRKLVYPWAGIHIVEDDFRQVTELNDMGRTEDVALGLNLIAKLGLARTGFGSDRNATIFEAAASRGFEPGGPGRLLLLQAAATARDEPDGVRNSIVSFSGQYYQRNFGNGLLTVLLRTVIGNALDFENQVLLGGDNDLRGYPLRYQSGERSAILTVEQRFFTDWYPFSLLRVGYAFFVDAGRVWGDDLRSDPNLELGTLYDVGVGLRLTSPKSSSGSVLHLDLAFPVNAPPGIDSMQISLERKGSF